MALRASAIGGRRADTRCMSAMREELHHLADLLPEAGLRPAPELIRAHAAGEPGHIRHCRSVITQRGKKTIGSERENRLHGGRKTVVRVSGY